MKLEVNLAIAAVVGGILAVSPALAQDSVGTPTQRGPGNLTNKAPDLIPVPSRITTGTASVRNAGSADAGPFILTVQCQVQGGGGGCTEDHPGMARFEHPAYPGRAVINVPGLAAGHVFNFKFPFWDDLVWLGATVNFLLEADAGKTVGETNEGNNFGGVAYSP